MTAVHAAAVFFGGGLGSVARWAVGEMCARWWPTVVAITRGSTLRTRPVAFKTRVAQELEAEVWPLIESGKIRVVTGRILPLAQAAASHSLMESAGHTGKILLTL